MGTPAFALPTLAQLCARYPVVGVVTQPDRPAGRGRKVIAPPVKEMALAEGIAVFQPKNLRRVEAIERIRAWAPDLIVVAAFGQILPPAVLRIPRYGALNVHASLLPRWRGAAPIQAAILAGDERTGVTIMQMDEGLDTGPILAQRETAIGPLETAGQLEERLAQMGAELLIEVLPDYLAGRLQPRPQPEEGVTLARRLPKEAARLDWNESAEALARRVRAFAPKPGAYTEWEGKRLKVLLAKPLDVAGPEGAIPGTVFVREGRPAVVTGGGDALLLLQLQMAGKRPLTGEVFLRGSKKMVGAVLGAS